MDVQMQDATTSGAKSTNGSGLTSLLGSSLNSTAGSASQPQTDAAKLEALRKATLHSYKNKFLNLRDKFDKVNATNAEYNTTLTSAKKKELSLQEEIDVLLDYLAEHGANDPDIARCLTNPPVLPNAASSSSRPAGQNGN
ncbi:hypothetical protein FRC19_011626 [Serendipita sp. 401]|nr:hypothetical protein FRC15_011106 [Serendipita sp. 397]KAG8817102.1 hypothetical protein FRC19_011626 [Serendipita sp. 401]KAG8856104.1 hypothetical protein FRC20_000553 [Serendipita sp. 405]KAG9051906.1 hypothetical protein FS842_010847 [Serendipita sp. 407]